MQGKGEKTVREQRPGEQSPACTGSMDSLLRTAEPGCCSLGVLAHLSGSSKPVLGSGQDVQTGSAKPGS